MVFPNWFVIIIEFYIYIHDMRERGCAELASHRKTEELAKSRRVDIHVCVHTLNRGISRSL